MRKYDSIAEFYYNNRITTPSDLFAKQNNTIISLAESNYCTTGGYFLGYSLDMTVIEHKLSPVLSTYNDEVRYQFNKLINQKESGVISWKGWSEAKEHIITRRLSNAFSLFLKLASREDQWAHHIAVSPAANLDEILHQYSGDLVVVAAYRHKFKRFPAKYTGKRVRKFI